MKKLPTSNILVLLLLLFILAAASLASYYLFFSNNGVRDDAPLNKALNPKEGSEGFTDIDGNKLTLSDYFGQLLVVTSWASWCPQCATDLPALAEFSKEFDEKDVKILAVDRAENRFTAERFLNSIASTEGLIIILDPEDQFFEVHEGYAMPETLLYDKKGNVVLHQRGALNIEELRTAITNLNK